MIKRAHAEERPYRLIVPVVLHFRLLVADCLFGTDYAENTEKGYWL